MACDRIYPLINIPKAGVGGALRAPSTLIFGATPEELFEKERDHR